MVRAREGRKIVALQRSDQMTQDSCPESPSSSVASFHSTDPASDSDLPFELHRGVDPSSERVGDDSLPQQDPPDDDDEDDTEHDDSIWWTPSELRVESRCRECPEPRIEITELALASFSGHSGPIYSSENARECRIRSRAMGTRNGVLP